MMSISWHHLALLSLVAACGPRSYVVIDGKHVERPSVAYDNGTTFHLEHDRAYPGVFDPRRPQDVDDGTLVGRLCGVDLDFDASWYGARLVVQGRGDVPWLRDFSHTEGLFQLELAVTELAPGHRRIRGRAPGDGLSAPAVIDIDVSGQGLTAEVGLRRFTLTADGEYLFGRMKLKTNVRVPIDAPYAIYGRQVLASMVPADQALVLVMMLSCDGPAIEHDGTLVRGFAMVPLPPKS